MTATASRKTANASITRMVRKLQSDMADLVALGDMTAEEASERVNRKTDQWMVGGLS